MAAQGTTAFCSSGVLLLPAAAIANTTRAASATMRLRIDDRHLAKLAKAGDGHLAF